MNNNLIQREKFYTKEILYHFGLMSLYMGRICILHNYFYFHSNEYDILYGINKKIDELDLKLNVNQLHNTCRPIKLI